MNPYRYPNHQKLSREREIKINPIKKETLKYFPTTIIFLMSKKKIEFHTTLSLYFFLHPVLCCLLFSRSVSFSISFFRSPFLRALFFVSFIRCYFDAINQILFTMCSNRKMFSNKFMAVRYIVFVRFHGRFTLFFFLFEMASQSCFHVPTCDNKKLKRFYNVPECAPLHLFLSLILIAASYDRLLLLLLPFGHSLSLCMCVCVRDQNKFLWAINDIRNIL